MHAIEQRDAGRVKGDEILIAFGNSAFIFRSLQICRSNVHAVFGGLCCSFRQVQQRLRRREERGLGRGYRAIQGLDHQRRPRNSSVSMRTKLLGLQRVQPNAYD